LAKKHTLWAHRCKSALGGKLLIFTVGNALSNGENQGFYLNLKIAHASHPYFSIILLINGSLGHGLI
jgi:hypothetical protein